MHKVLPAIRTMFLLFIIVYALWAASPWDGVTATVTLEAWHRLQRVAWIAIAWIGFETLLGWIMAAFRRPRAATTPPHPGTAPTVSGTGARPASPPSPRS